MADRKTTVRSERVLKADRTRRFDPASLYVYFIFCIFPLLIGPNVYLDITDTKFFIFCGTTVIALMAYFIFRCVQGKKEAVPSGYQPAFVCLTVFCCWAIVSAFVSVYGWDNVFLGQSRYEGLLSILLYAGAFFLASRCSRLPSSFPFVLAVSAFIIAAIAVAQEFGSTVLYPEGYTYKGVQFLTTLGQHDCLSGYCSVMIPLMTARAVLAEHENEHPKKWIFYIFVISVLSYAMLESGVDSGRLAVLCGIAFVLPFLIDSRKHVSRSLFVTAGLSFALLFKSMLTVSESYDVTVGFTVSSFLFLAVAAASVFAGTVLWKQKKEFSVSPEKIRKTCIFVLLGLGVAVLVSVFFYQGSDLTVLEASELMHGRLDDRAGQLRGYIWKSTIDIIKNNPFFGTGPGTFAASFEPYAAGYMEYSPNTGVDMAHNDFLQIAACTGIPGLFLYLLFLGTLFWGAIRSIRNRCGSAAEEDTSSGEIPALLAGITGYLVFSCFGFSIAIYTPLFWVEAGLLAGRCQKQ